MWGADSRVESKICSDAGVPATSGWVKAVGAMPIVWVQSIERLKGAHRQHSQESGCLFPSLQSTGFSDLAIYSRQVQRD